MLDFQWANTFYYKCIENNFFKFKNHPENKFDRTDILFE